MQHLLEDWPAVAGKVAAARHILALTDFDGTLTPIVSSPELAELPVETRKVLENLARRERFTVGVVSGRAIADLKSKVGIPGIIYSGNHGMEIEAPHVSFPNPLYEDLAPMLRSMHRELVDRLGKIKGVRIEDKGLSLSVHYRAVEHGHVGEMKRAFERFARLIRVSGKLRVTAGKKSYNIQPAGWDKGYIVGLLIKTYRKGGSLLPIYLGDDVTDEDAFRNIPKSGISVFIGKPNRRTAANYYLENPVEVTRFLETLVSS